MLHTLILVVHIFVCFALILIVLLQAGKGGDFGTVFGGSNQTVFGTSGASTFLTKLTTYAAIIFIVSSFSLAFLASKQESGTLLNAKPSSETLPKTPTQQPLSSQPNTSAPIEEQSKEPIQSNPINPPSR